MKSYYRCTYYLNASCLDENEEIRKYTYTIMLSMGKREKHDKTNINDAENIVKDYLAQFDGKVFNELPVFQYTMLDIEGIGNMIYEDIKKLFRATPFSLYQLDISESPLSVYQISDRLLMPTLNKSNTEENYNNLLRQREQLRK